MFGFFFQFELFVYKSVYPNGGFTRLNWSMTFAETYTTPSQMRRFHSKRSEAAATITS